MSPLQPQDVGIGRLFWAIRDAVVVGSVHTGRIVLWSPSAAALFGYAEDEAVGMPLDTLIPDRFKAAHHAGLARYGATRHGTLIDSGHAAQVAARRKDGEELAIELTLTPLEQIHPHDDLLVLALIRDVTERVRADRAQLQLVREQAERQAAEAAEERAHFLARIGDVLAASLDVETIAHNIARLMVPALGDWCIVDLLSDGEPSHVVPLRRVATVAASAEQEAALREIQRRYPSDASSPQPASRAVRGGAPVFFSRVTPDVLAAATIDAEHRRLVQALQPRSILAVPLLARGQTLGAISLVRAASERYYDESDLALAQDVARRCALALDNARLYQEAQAAIQTREEFLSIAAHELRTPITSLRGFAQVLLRRLEHGEPLERSDVLRRLAIINMQAGKLTRLVAQLLDVSRLEAGKLALERVVTDVGALVERVVESVPAGAQHPIAVHAAQGTLARVDPLRLEQVVTNLVDNAIKYSPKGGAIDLDVAVVAPQTVQILVQDRGLGIPPAQQGHVFERFYQAHADDHRSGMGLGLYICRQIVELHGGQMSLESDVGRGTCVRILLPQDL